jgi:hypothetical protein
LFFFSFLFLSVPLDKSGTSVLSGTIPEKEPSPFLAMPFQAADILSVSQRELMIFCIVFHINQTTHEIIQGADLTRLPAGNQLLRVIEVYRKSFDV